MCADVVSLFFLLLMLLFLLLKDALKFGTELIFLMFKSKFFLC